MCKDPFDDGETLKQLNEALKDSTSKAAGLLAPVFGYQFGSCSCCSSDRCCINY
jgi:hypothetical protein